MAKYKVELNSKNNIRDLLQEAYRLADEQIVLADKEITKLASATKLNEEPMDAKAKYAKAVNDYMGMKDKAIGKKLDIAKVLKEIIVSAESAKAQKGAEEMKTNSGTIDFAQIRKMVEDAYDEKPKKKTITMDEYKKTE